MCVGNFWGCMSGILFFPTIRGSIEIYDSFRIQGSKFKMFARGVVRSASPPCVAWYIQRALGCASSSERPLAWRGISNVHWDVLTLLGVWGLWFS